MKKTRHLKIHHLSWQRPLEMKFSNKVVYFTLLFFMLGITQLYSQTSSNLTIPGAPTIFLAEAGGGQLQLAFNYPTQDEINNPITNYEYTLDNGVTWVTLSPVSTSFVIWIHDIVDYCSAYQIKVRAVAQFTGAGPASEVYNYSGNRSKITSIYSRNNSLKVNINNDFSHSVSNYEYSIDGGLTWTLRSPASNSTPLIITGLTNGTSYPISVKPVLTDQGRLGCPSEVVSATPNLVDTANLTAPGAITINNVIKNFDILEARFYVPSQDSNNPIDHYEYSIDNGVTWVAESVLTYPYGEVTTLASTVTSQYTSVRIAGLQNCTANNIKVRAVAEFTGAGTASNTFNYLDFGSKITSIIPRDGSLRVNFTGTGNAGYYVTNYNYSIDGGTTWTPLSPAQNSSPLTINGLSNGTNYAIQIKAILTGYEPAFYACPSQIVSATPNPVNTSNLIAPGAPTIQVVNMYSGMLNVYFSGPTQDSVNNAITNYEYSLDNGITWIANAPASTNTNIMITGLEDCSSHTIKVRAVAEFTGAGPASSTYIYSGARSIITSVVTRDGSVKLNVSNTSVPYQITNYEYSTDGGTTWTPRSPASTTLPLVISGLTNNTTYSIAVKPVLMNAPTNLVLCTPIAVAATPVAGTVPQALTNISAISSNAGGSISFTLPSDGGADITNYQYSVDNGVTWISPTPAIVSSPLNITGLTNCSTYQVIIRAVNSLGSGASSSPIAIAPLNVAVLGTTWTARTAASALNWSSVTYGNGLFVAVARSSGTSKVMTSPDGINWTSRMPSSTDMNWNCVTYGNGLFVAVGILTGASTDKTVMTSPDGITWTERTAINNYWNSVVYGNGLFVAVAIGENSVMTSADGIIWTERTGIGSVTTSWSSITYGNGKFVAVSNLTTSNKVMYSDDGINWTSVNGIDGKPWNRITYGNGTFVASAAAGALQNIMTSTNGINWVLRDHPIGGLPCIAFGNGLFVAMGNGTNKIMTSPDAITWTAKTSPSAGYQSVVYGNGKFVAVSAAAGGNYRVTTSETAAVADAPVITSATIGSTATVAFTQTVSSIASAITNYEYSTDNGTTWVAVAPTATASPLTINGVPSGATQIMLRAVNSVGVSCASNNFISNVDCTPTTTTETVTAYNIYTWEVNGQTYTTSGTYSLVTACDTKNLNLTILAQPAPPTGLSCYEVATWNPAISDYEISAALPVAPSINCYQSTEWDDTTCSWII
ncbi:hypothetical protein, partial [Flavobacterium sp.]|uniref:hypothetical protein n=1 Tax=Flavobacterium sp. TaxID=239 RepID=UPI003BEE2953